ncbi:unnamed protein product, partial [Chrysoparadoxa australica]
CLLKPPPPNWGSTAGLQMKALWLLAFVGIVAGRVWAAGHSRSELRISPHVKRNKEHLALADTDLSRTDVHIWIVTTASLPWMTGTSINPLLRAAFLTRGRDPGMVTLMLPYLEVDDQHTVFPEGTTFSTPEEQGVRVKAWLEDAGMAKEADRLNLVFYPGRYHSDYGSIFPMGDITKLVPRHEADICILEEPEHLNWYRAPGESWNNVFGHVVGVVHTNYLAYSSGYGIWAPVLTFMLRYMNKLVARGHTHKIIKLSAVIQQLAEEKETVCNVHGVRDDFLEIGDYYSHGVSHNSGAYFIGKSLWAKGYDRLLDLVESLGGAAGPKFHLDVYGSGPDSQAIQKRAKKRRVPATFFPATDHAKLGDYKVFVNPSRSEVLCTTIAEALAMGKWVVCARHPSNEFFYQFPNCLPFETKEEFGAALLWALRHEPPPLQPLLRHELTWDAATTRFVLVCCVT